MYIYNISSRVYFTDFVRMFGCSSLRLETISKVLKSNLNQVSNKENS